MNVVNSLIVPMLVVAGLYVLVAYALPPVAMYVMENWALDNEEDSK